MFRNPLTTTSPGYWLNPASLGMSPIFRVLEGVSFNQYATLQVRVWDITKYASYAEAFAAGESLASAPFNYRVPYEGELGPAVYYMNDLRAFGPATLSTGSPCPEPSTWALLTIGAIAWLWSGRVHNNPKGCQKLAGGRSVSRRPPESSAWILNTPQG